MKEITRLSLVRIVCRRSKIFYVARNKEEKQQVLVEREEEKRDTKKEYSTTCKI